MLKLRFAVPDWITIQYGKTIFSVCMVSKKTSIILRSMLSKAIVRIPLDS